MQMKTALSTLTLAAMIAAGLSTSALADRGPRHMMPMIDFYAIDTNKDGKITQDEIAAHHKARISEADTSADGKLSPGELVVMHQKARAARELDRVSEMIEQFDDDKDGFLSEAEMPKGPESGRMFDRVDTDGDGAISREEMEAVGEKLRGRHGGHRGGWGSGAGGDDTQDDN